MIIYIESVIINNMAINMAIFYVLATATRRVAKLWRIILASIIGTMYAIISPLIAWQGEIILKIALSLIMSAISSKFKGIIEYLKYLILFYIITFSLGGIVIGISYIYQPVSQIINSPNNISLALILSIGVVVMITIRVTIRRLAIKTQSKYAVNTTAVISGKSLNVSGYLDSGNRVYYRGVFPVVAIDQTLLDCPIGRIKISTINSIRSIPVYPIERIEVNGRIYRNVYAIPQQIASEYPIILHCSML